jgi:hypothetical protein
MSTIEFISGFVDLKDTNENLGNCILENLMFEKSYNLKALRNDF